MESVNFISALLCSESNFRSISGFLPPQRAYGTSYYVPGLCDRACTRPWSTAPCVLTDCRQISLKWLTLCFSRYCSASVRNTDLSALIFQAPFCHYSRRLHSYGTVATDHRGEGGRLVGGAHWDENDKRCVFHKMHIRRTRDFQLVYEHSVSLSVASVSAEGISHLAVVSLAWMVDVLHKGHVIINHAHTFRHPSHLFLSLSTPLSNTCTYLFLSQPEN